MLPQVREARMPFQSTRHNIDVTARCVDLAKSDSDPSRPERQLGECPQQGAEGAALGVRPVRQDGESRSFSGAPGALISECQLLTMECLT